MFNLHLLGSSVSFDGWVFAFSFITVVATIAMGFWSARTSKTAGDFFVAGRSVSVGWNASAISGEYLSAASSQFFKRWRQWEHTGLQRLTFRSRVERGRLADGPDLISDTIEL